LFETDLKLTEEFVAKLRVKELEIWNADQAKKKNELASCF
jgi:hypothetical protein